MTWHSAITIANPALRRAARTFLQAFLGVATISSVLPFISAAIVGGDVNYSALRVLLASAVGAGVTALYSYVQNALEDKTGKSIAIEKHA